MSDVSTLTTSAPDRSWESLPDRLNPPMPSSGWRGWIGPVIVMIIGGLIRFVSLGRPHGIAFDETYYAKDAISLLRFGYEKQFVGDANDLLLNSDGNIANLKIFQDAAEYMVHPPFGKWAIASGEALFGATPFGWRFAVAVLGTLSILILARTLRRMTRSDLVGTIGGLILALDGIAIVMSRSAVLDNVLSFCVLAGFAFLVLDRDATRKRLAKLVGHSSFDEIATTWGPRLGLRPLRWAAAVMLGLACAVKWSGIWFIVVFGIMTVLWDVSARRMIGVKRPISATLLRDAPLAALSMVGIAIVVYLSTWTGWFLNENAWGRTWGLNDPSWIPQSLRALWHYHSDAWNFHTTLESPHAYQSNPIGWLLQVRPTSFYWHSDKGVDATCGADHCVSAVNAIGNPIVWWAATIALIHQLWRWMGRRDWRSGAVLAGVAAGWLPWMLYLNRTIFSFYTVAFVPFIAMALAMSLGTVIGPSTASKERRVWGALIAGGVILAIVFTAWWMYPVWTGEYVPYEVWRMRMWMPSWI